MINKIFGIAINEYVDPVLNDIHNCMNDLNEIIGILSTKYVFDSIELLSQKEQTTYRFLWNRLHDVLINSLSDENILIIYAGHGQFNHALNTSYWQPSDAIHNDQATWFELGSLIKFMKASKAFHISVISDSCFSGAIFDENQRGGGVHAIESKRSRLALTSGSIEKVSDGVQGGLSPFATTLTSILSTNTETALPFSFLSQKLILEFDKGRKQTPMYGSLFNAGHEGGSFIFRLKESSDSNDGVIEHTEMQLALDLKVPLNIEYDCKIPFFPENLRFNNVFVNAFIQHLAFEAISQVRSFFQEDQDYLIERNKEVVFDLNIGYHIALLNQKFLSLTISVENYFGGVHPNNYVYSLNFAFKPDRKLSFYDLIDYSRYANFEAFLKAMIERFSVDEEHMDILNRYAEYMKPHDLDFSFNESVLTVYFINHMPRAVMSAGFLEVPINDLKFKI